MNYTPNYHLPQWVKSDRIMMEDFNAMNSSIESGLTAAAATADDARADAAQARVEAQALPYVVGTYAGNGSIKEITLGFRPSAIIISSRYAGSDATAAAGACSFHAVTNSSTVFFRENGFGVSGTQKYPNVNIKDANYCYIAFR